MRAPSSDGVAILAQQLGLDRQARVPIVVQLVRGFEGALRSGRWLAGAELPGARALAAALGVSRNSVVAAYAELERMELIQLSQGRRPTVTAPPPTLEVPERASKRHAAALPPSPHLPPRRESDASTRYRLASGAIDPRLFPKQAFARASRRVIERCEPWLGYAADGRGLPLLRRELARLVSDARGIACTAEEILVTRGSQMAFALIARALAQPRFTVGVESLGYRRAWDALRSVGADIVPLAIDDEGLDVAQLDAAGRRLHAIYVTPHHQYPTTVTLSPARRAALLAHARRRGLFVIEDDYDFEFHFDGKPRTPLAASDPDGRVLYVGTLSKLVAPALRLGFIVARADIIERLTREREVMDRQGDAITEATVAQLLEDGTIGRHTQKVRAIMRERRDAVVDALGREFGDRLAFDVPDGGLAIWCSTRPPIDTAAWARRAARLGVELQPEAEFQADEGRGTRLRIGFARHTAGELRTALSRARRSMSSR